MPARERAQRSALRRWLLLSVRVVLPLLLVAGGIVLMVMGHGDYTSITANRNSLLSATGMALVIIAAMVALLNWFIRLTLTSDKDRDREEWARDYFTRTGHWPGEGGGPAHPR